MSQCGADFIWSLTYTYLGSGWIEGRAVWNKGAQGVVEQTKDVENHLPFGLLGMDLRLTGAARKVPTKRGISKVFLKRCGLYDKSDTPMSICS
ncbi:MAG: hypothetical protein ABI042_13560 [Verrucomicrobiota bacterium]